MRQTITIIHDSVSDTHLILVWDVSEGLPGESPVGTSTLNHHHVGVNDPGQTPATMWDTAALLVGVSNVRVLVIQGPAYVPTLEQVLRAQEAWDR